MDGWWLYISRSEIDEQRVFICVAVGQISVPLTKADSAFCYISNTLVAAKAMLRVQMPIHRWVPMDVPLEVTP